MKDLRGTWIHIQVRRYFHSGKVFWDDSTDDEDQKDFALDCFCWCCISELLHVRWLWELIGRP